MLQNIFFVVSTLCIVAILAVTIYTVLSKISEHTIHLLLTVPLKGQLAFFEVLVTIQRTQQQIFFIEDHLWPPLDIVRVDQERDLHKPNN